MPRPDPKYGIDCQKCGNCLFILYHGTDRQHLVNVMMEHVKAQHPGTQETEVKGWIKQIAP